MSILRRILGIFVMIAGIIGLVLSVAGLAGVWMAKPVLITSLDSTVKTLTSTIDTSQRALVVANEALGSTVDSVDALSAMLATTSDTVGDTQPVIVQVNNMMGETLPATLEAATSSLKAAEAAAVSLEDAIKSFESFRGMVSMIPFLSATLPPSTGGYNPEKPLADSLGELTASIEDVPLTFQEIAVSLEKSDDNLDLVKNNLNTMSVSVKGISASLKEYQTMVGESNKSMDGLKTMLAGFQSNLSSTLNTAVLVLTLFFLWLLAAQVVIFSQGLELFHGTATRMAGAEVKVEEEVKKVEEEVK